MGLQDLNEDGKLTQRIFATAVGTLPVVAIGALLWWSDLRTSTARTNDSIEAIEERMTKVEADAVETRNVQEENRRKIAELGRDIQSLLRSSNRIEAILDNSITLPRRDQ